MILNISRHVRNLHNGEKIINFLNMSKLTDSIKGKNKIIRHQISPYPRVLWVCKGEALREAPGRFTPLGFTWGEYEEYKGYNGMVFKVYETETKDMGYLVWLDDDAYDTTCVHEAGHVALHLFQDIGEAGIYDAQEPFAYMLEWIYGRIKDCCNGK